MLNRKVNKGVILAAGDGGRLQPVTGIHPKVLVPVQGKPLIWYPIEAMAAAGVRQIAVVVGYLASEVREALGDGRHLGVSLEYILNQDYCGGNAISVSKVRAWAAGEPLILCMGDHMIEPGIVSRLLQSSLIIETLCVDFAPAGWRNFAEATKVIVDGSGCIKHIGKELAYWDGLDTGVFFLTEKFLDAIDELLPEIGSGIEISDVIQFMVNKRSQFATCDVSACFWVDVDTEKDLEHVIAWEV